MSRQRIQDFRTEREYHDDPDHTSEFSNDSQFFADIGFSSFEEALSQITCNKVNINNGARVLENASNSIGTDRDNGHASEKVHGISQETGKVVQSTARLMKQLANKKLNGAQTIKLYREKNKVQESIQRFNTLQKKSLEQAKTASRVEKPKLLDAEEDDQTQLVADDTRRTQLVAQKQAVYNDLALIQDRGAQIRELEAGIRDLSGLFRNMLTIVADQGEERDTDSIEENCEKAYKSIQQMEVEEATNQVDEGTRLSLKALLCQNLTNQDADEDDQTQLVADDTIQSQLMAQQQVIYKHLDLIQDRGAQIRQFEENSNGSILDSNWAM